MRFFHDERRLPMAINVVGFENVQFVDFNPDPASGVPNDLFLITGVALIQPFSGTTGNQGGWTRDTCSFDVPSPDGQPFLFSGGDVSASAVVFPASVQNVGSQDIGFGVDSAFALVLTKTERLSIGIAGFCQSTCPTQQVSMGSVKQMVIGKRLLHLRLLKQG